MEKTTKIKYSGASLTELYKLALIGAENCTEKNENGITIINSIKKQLYIKTVEAARLLQVAETKEDEMMSIDEFNKCAISVNNIGTGKARFVADVELFKAILDDEIRNVIICENDIMTRINEAIKAEITPENIEKMNKSKDELIEKLDEMKNEA